MKLLILSLDAVLILDHVQNHLQDPLGDQDPVLALLSTTNDRRLVRDLHHQHAVVPDQGNSNAMYYVLFEDIF